MDMCREMACHLSTMPKFKNNMKTTIITLIFSVLCLCGVDAQQQLSLEEAIKKGLENNYNIKIDKKRVENSEVYNSWGAAGALPSFTFETSQSNMFKDGDTQLEKSHQLTPSVKLNWTLFDGFAMFIAKNKLNEKERLAKGNLALITENTIQNIMSAYYLALLEKEKLNTYENIAKLSEDRYNKSKKMVDVGAQTTYDNLQSRDAYLQDRANFLQQQSSYKNSIRDLNYVMGISEDTEYELTNSFDPKIENVTFDDMFKKLSANNTTIKNQFINLNIAEQDIKAAKSNYLPSISLNAGYSYSKDKSKPKNQDMITSDYSTINAGLSLRWNIYSGGSKRRALQIAKINKEIEEISLNDMKHSLKNNLLKLLDTYNVRKEVFKLSQERLETAKLNLSMSTKKFENGSINSFNYRDVQVRYQNTANSHYLNIYNLIDSWLSLLKITGGIVEVGQ